MMRSTPFLRTALWIALKLAIFLAAFTFTSSTIRAQFEDTPSYDSNFAYYLEHKNQYNVVFAGSSVVNSMVDPRVFDRVLNEAGYKVRSFNIGRGGAFAHETNYMLRQLVKHPGLQPAFVFVDLQPFTPDMRNPRSQRARDWHDLRESISTVVSVIRAHERTGTEKRELLTQHLRLALDRYVPTGKYFEEREEPTLQDQIYCVEYQGYRPLNIQAESNSMIAYMGADLRKNPDKYAQLVARRIEELNGPEEDFPRGINARATAAQRGLLESYGIAPIFVAAPSLLYDPRETRWIQQNADLEHVLLYDDPSEHPELHAFSARHDLNHLNEESSGVYSERIARDFLELLRREPDLASRLQRYSQPVKAVSPPS